MTRSANPALAGDTAKLRLLPRAMGVALHRPPPRERLGLYGLLGITKGDKDAMHAQHQCSPNFDAPVGLLHYRPRDGARQFGRLRHVHPERDDRRPSRGLHTCPQAAWNSFAKIIAPIIGMGEAS